MQGKIMIILPDLIRCSSLMNNQIFQLKIIKKILTDLQKSSLKQLLSLNVFVVPFLTKPYKDNRQLLPRELIYFRTCYRRWNLSRSQAGGLYTRYQEDQKILPAI